MPDHHYALPSGHMLAEYRIDRVLGAGGFGITYYAWDTNLDKPVAIKEYMPGDFAVRVNAGMVQAKSSGAAANFRKFLKDFLQEARVLARFEHPHVNKVHRYFEANGTAYMVLEYMDGETLSDMLRREGQLAPKFLRRLLGELLLALEAVHAARYVHRDVKPANIMLRGDGSVVLLDFGIARRVIGQTNITVALTRVYAPIEQYEQDAKKVGAWTDLYALGMVAYRCVSGIAERELPDAVTRGNWKRRGEAGNLRPAVEIGAGKYDENLLRAVDHAIEVYEDERPQSVAEMRKELGVFTPVLSAESKQLAQKFLGRDFSPTAKDANGWTDLHYAAAGDWVEVAEFLLGAGAEVEARAIGGVNAQMYGGDEYAGKVAIDTLNNIWNTAYNFSARDVTPLHIAALANAEKAAAVLLENGADIEAKYNNGQTPLHVAANHNAGNSVALLLENGADIEAKDEIYGQTPLHVAANHNAGNSVALLLENGADIEAKDEIYGQTPLHSAASASADKVFVLLLDKGADIEAKDDGGQTPLHAAAWEDDDKTVALLLENGADIEAKDKNAETPLHFATDGATGEGDAAVSAVLLENGANIKAKDKYGWTPLANAVRENADAYTLLYFAATECADRTVELLLKNAAYIAEKDADGNTRLHWVAWGEADRTAALLLKCGANREARNNSGETPLDVANRESSAKVVRLLEN